MKPISERMHRTATDRRIRTPAIWTILKYFAVEAKQIEEENKELLRALRHAEYRIHKPSPDSCSGCEEVDTLLAKKEPPCR